MASASTGAVTSPTMRRLWDRGEVIGAAVLAFAGIAWFGWAQADPPSSWVPYLVTGSVVSALLLVALVVVLLRRRTTTGSPMADPGVRRRYWVTVVVEVVLIVAGNLLLAAVGHPAYDAAWTLFVVGVHFVPLARIFHSRGLALAGVVTAVVAVAAAGLGVASDLAPSAAAGAGGGVVFIGYAAWVAGAHADPAAAVTLAQRHPGRLAGNPPPHGRHRVSRGRRVGGRVVGGGWWGGEMSDAVDPGMLPGQLTLDLPGLDPPAGRPVPRRRARPVVEELPAVLGVPAVPPRVWGVWDGENLVGIYAEEQVARADAAVLQRDAVRAGVRASTIDCLALPVLTAPQHQHGRRGR